MQLVLLPSSGTPREGKATRIWSSASSQGSMEGARGRVQIQSRDE